MNKLHRITGLGLFVLCFLPPLSIFAQESESELRDELEALRRGQETMLRQIELMQEVEALKKGQEEIRKELAEIKKLLQARPAARAAAAGPSVRDTVFDLGGNPIRGESTAKLILVEFTDYQ